jgi:outer membrane receptor protein involved in Fe transport
MYVDSFENDFAKIDSGTQQNIRVIWRPNGSKNLSVQGFVENITDEDNIDYLIPTSFIGGVAGAYGPPRIWGLVVNWDIL